MRFYTHLTLTFDSKIIAVIFFFPCNLDTIGYHCAKFEQTQLNLNAYTKSKEEGKDQKLKPYHHLTDLEIASIKTQMNTSGKL